jgi:hypothetical protein
MVRHPDALSENFLLRRNMDSKEHARKGKEYIKAKEEHRREMIARDQAVHGENSRVKYDPTTGSLKEE